MVPLKFDGPTPGRQVQFWCPAPQRTIALHRRDVNMGGTGEIQMPTYQVNTPDPLTGTYFNGSLQPSTAQSWSTASASYAAPAITGGASSALTTRSSSGVTVTAAAANALGITFTPITSAAVYWVRASMLLVSSGIAGTIVGVRITDGTNTVGIWQSQPVTSTIGSLTVDVAGIFVPATGNAVTLSIQAATSSGTITMGYGSASNSLWSGADWQLVRLR